MAKKKTFEPATKTSEAEKAECRAWTPEVLASGVVDWGARDHEGRTFYGSTQAEAEKSRADYHK